MQVDKTEALKLSADTVAGVTIGVTNIPENPEMGGLIVTIITIITRILAEKFIERLKRKRG
jgi:hypothetical protein